MKIIANFEICKKILYSVQFQNTKKDEFALAFDQWSDIGYLYDFFEIHRSDLANGFYREKYGSMTIQDAINITLEQAEALERRLKAISTQRSKNGLDIIFRPLNNLEYRHVDLQKSKAKGERSRSWLRIYAIRVSNNFYVVCGSSIKLTANMNERAHLRLQLTKLEFTKNYLREQGISDKDDYELLEI